MRHSLCQCLLGPQWQSQWYTAFRRYGSAEDCLRTATCIQALMQGQRQSGRRPIVGETHGATHRLRDFGQADWLGMRREGVSLARLFGESLIHFR